MAGRVRTVGVEEELMLFAAHGEQPAPAGEALASDPGNDVEHEFKLEQAEIVSQPAEELHALGADLRERRAELIESAAQRGVVVAGLGTSPVPTRPTATPDERYQRMHEQYGLVAGEQLTCGMHVHVSIASRAEGIAIIDKVRPWLAVLLALSANSPFWYGRDTGYASYRRISWGRWPTAGPTQLFEDEARYDQLVRALIESGAAVDDAMIYFDVRLSANYPTVEFRVADIGQEVADSVLVAALCRALADLPATSDVPVAILTAAAWRASRFGLEGELLDVVDGRLRPAADVLDHLLDALRPSLHANGDTDFVHDAVQQVLRRGTGAQAQRRDYERRGRLRDVVLSAAERTG